VCGVVCVCVVWCGVVCVWVSDFVRSVILKYEAAYTRVGFCATGNGKVVLFPTMKEYRKVEA
jgi:hypothetical protein